MKYLLIIVLAFSINAGAATRQVTVSNETGVLNGVNTNFFRDNAVLLKSVTDTFGYGGSGTGGLTTNQFLELNALNSINGVPLGGSNIDVSGGSSVNLSNVDYIAATNVVVRDKLSVDTIANPSGGAVIYPGGHASASTALWDNWNSKYIDGMTTNDLFLAWRTDILNATNNLYTLLGLNPFGYLTSITGLTNNLSDKALVTATSNTLFTSISLKLDTATYNSNRTIDSNFNFATYITLTAGDLRYDPLGSGTAAGVIATGAQTTANSALTLAGQAAFVNSNNTFIAGRTNTFNDIVIFKGTVAVSNNVVIASNLTVNGITTLASNLYVAGQLIVSNSMTASNLNVNVSTNSGAWRIGSTNEVNDAEAFVVDHPRNGQHVLMIGTIANVGSNNGAAVVIGNNATANFGCDGVSIGSSAAGYGCDDIVVGLGVVSFSSVVYGTGLTGSNEAVVVGMGAAGYDGATLVGENSIVRGGVGIGNLVACTNDNNTITTTHHAVAVGDSSQARGQRSTAIGGSAGGRFAVVATAKDSVEIGSGTNSTAGTLAFMAHQLVNSNGDVTANSVTTTNLTVSNTATITGVVNAGTFTGNGTNLSNLNLTDSGGQLASQANTNNDALGAASAVSNAVTSLGYTTLNNVSNNFLNNSQPTGTWNNAMSKTESNGSFTGASLTGGSITNGRVMSLGAQPLTNAVSVGTGTSLVAAVVGGVISNKSVLLNGGTISDDGKTVTLNITPSSSGISTNQFRAFLAPGAALCFGSVSNMLILPPAQSAGFGVQQDQLVATTNQLSVWQICALDYTGGPVNFAYSYVDSSGGASKTNDHEIWTSVLTNGASAAKAFATDKILSNVPNATAGLWQTVTGTFTPSAWSANTTLDCYIGLFLNRTNAPSNTSSTNTFQTLKLWQ